MILNESDESLQTSKSPPRWGGKEEEESEGGKEE